MATQVQLRRGTAAQNDAFTGAQGELSYDTTNKRLRVHDGATAGGFEIKTEDLGGDVSFADNEKAIFGSGSDLLQIYRNSSGSYVKESGSGSLYIQGTDVRIQNASGENILNGTSNGAVTLYYDNAPKIATTSTGVDITGTLTSDGLTVTGESIISSATTVTDLSNPILQLTGSSYTANGVYGIGFNYNTDGSGTSPVFAGYQLTSGSGNTKGNLVFGTRDTTTAGDVPLIRQKIAPNGDINFYAADGSTPAFHWDAADERLGLGTNLPSVNLHVEGAGNQFILLNNSTTNDGFYFKAGAGASSIQTNAGSHVMNFFTSGEERMRISAAGDMELIQGNNLYWKHAGGGTIRAGITADSSDNLAFSTGSSDSTAMTIDGSGNVGIKVVPEASHAPSLAIGFGGNNITSRGNVDFRIMSGAYQDGASTFKYSVSGLPVSMLSMTNGAYGFGQAPAGTDSNTVSFSNSMTLDANGDLMHGTTNTSLFSATSGSGTLIEPTGVVTIARQTTAATQPLFILNTTGVDSILAQFRKDGSPVGSIGTITGGIYIGDGDTGLEIDGANDAIYPFNTTTQVATNGHTDLGDSDKRFKDLYLSGNIDVTTTTSGLISAGAARQGSIIKLHHEAQWEAGYNSTPTDFLGAVEFSSGDGSGTGLAGEGVRAAIRATVQDAYNNVGLLFETGGSRTRRMLIDHNGAIYRGKASANSTYTYAELTHSHAGNDASNNADISFTIAFTNTSTTYDNAQIIIDAATHGNSAPANVGSVQLEVRQRASALQVLSTTNPIYGDSLSVTTSTNGLTLTVNILSSGNSTFTVGARCRVLTGYYGLTSLSAANQ